MTNRSPLGRKLRRKRSGWLAQVQPSHVGLPFVENTDSEFSSAGLIVREFKTRMLSSENLRFGKRFGVISVTVGC